MNGFLHGIKLLSIDPICAGAAVPGGCRHCSTFPPRAQPHSLSSTQKLTEMEKASEALLEVEKKASAMERGKEQAFCYNDEVMVAMNALRKPADELEKLVDKKYWPFPTYADLLFEV